MSVCEKLLFTSLSQGGYKVHGVCAKNEKSVKQMLERLSLLNGRISVYSHESGDRRVALSYIEHLKQNETLHIDHISITLIPSFE